MTWDFINTEDTRALDNALILARQFEPSVMWIDGIKVIPEHEIINTQTKIKRLIASGLLIPTQP